MYKPDKGEYSVKIESEIEVTQKIFSFFFLFSNLWAMNVFLPVQVRKFLQCKL